VVATDAARGILMIKGAVPGAKGGFVLVRDAVKRALPEGVPMPGAVRGGNVAVEQKEEEA
ncbi:MAG: 50S ribosomal protein L3, partial [Alphaproteobacteria bacterium]|nr:50S ribosomal protein L3 [Alphaproteobacteria bacterium]